MTNAEQYEAERFEHYRAMGEDHGDAASWAAQDRAAKFGPATPEPTITARVTPTGHRYFVELTEEHTTQKLCQSFLADELRKWLADMRAAAKKCGKGFRIADETGEIFPVVMASKAVRRALYADFVTALSDADVKHYGYERAAAEALADHAPRGLSLVTV